MAAILSWPQCVKDEASLNKLFLNLSSTRKICYYWRWRKNLQLIRDSNQSPPGPIGLFCICNHLLCKNIEHIIWCQEQTQKGFKQIHNIFNTCYIWNILVCSVSVTQIYSLCLILHFCAIHLTLVTKWSRSWSWMTYCQTLCAMWIGPPILRYSYLKIWPWKSMVKVTCVVKGQGYIWPSNFKGQDYGQGQTHWSHLRPGVQSICLFFVSCQSDHFWLRYGKFHIWPWKFKVKVMAKVKPDSHIGGLGVQSICLLNVPWQLDHFWMRYSKFHIWPWKFKVKVMAKVKHDGHILALEFNLYVCFSFRGNWTILAEIWQIPYFTL